MQKVSLKKTENDRADYKWRVYYPNPNGKDRLSRRFKIKTLAEKFKQEKEDELDEYGAAHGDITKGERIAVMRLRDKLATLDNSEGLSLADAIDRYIEVIEVTRRSMTMAQLSDDLIDVLEGKKRSERYIDSIKSIRKRFNAEYGDWLACDVSEEIIIDYLSEMKQSDTSKRNHRQVLYQVFDRGVVNGSVIKNPITEASSIDKPIPEPEILVPKDVSTLLNHADDVCLAPLCIGFFAGLRRAEIERLEWKNVKLSSGVIIVRADTSKSKRRRTVKISDNLKAWLEPIVKKNGLVIPDCKEWRKSYEKARKAAGVNWVNNACRHSFVSYHIAMHGDSGVTATQVGHRNTSVLEEHYKELVEPQEAVEYWSIFPPNQNKVTSIKTA